MKILNGETLRLHPSDRLRIMDISTNICFNLGVRLVARDLDINALVYQELAVSELLEDRDIYDRYSFRVLFKQYNQDMGYIDIFIEPFVEDWLDKAERSINIEKKLAVLEDASEFAPEDKRIKDRLIKEYVSINQWEKAALMLEEMAREDGADRSVLLELLGVYEAVPKVDSVISVLRRLIGRDPDDIDTRFRLAETLEKSGREEEAIKEYEILLGKMTKGDLLPVYKSLGFLYTKRRQTNKAITCYLNAVEMDEDDINLYYNLSSLYEQAGQKDEADIFLGKAVNLGADDTEGRLRLSESLINKGRLEEAQRYLDEVFRKEPNSTKAWMLMTRIAEKRGNKGELKNAYENILALDPQNMTVIYNLGIIEYEMGNMTKAQPYLEKYIKFFQKDHDARVFLFDIYSSQKKEDLAFNEAMAIIRLRPQEIDFYHYLFEYLNKREKYGDMIKVMEDGLKANNLELDLMKYLIVAYLKTGKDDLAVKQIEEILKVNPMDLAMLLQLAKLQEKRGNVKEALDAYKKVMDISPGHEEAEDAYLRLRIEVLPGD
ncbi:tetratricopeptide repeat protein [Deltaproteobacteria bacterium]|nr:tetratricopeptide repeat protein [Deltaproteobacteria bacterium]